MSLEDTTGQEVDIDVDKIMSELDAPTPERPMSGPSEPSSESSGNSAQPSQLKPQAQPSQVQEYEFTWNGQKIKAPVDKLTKWASQGYDYSQRMEAFKRQQQEYDAKLKHYSRYDEIDQYAKKDPDWWKYVEEQYKNRLAATDPIGQRLQSVIDEKLKPVNEFLELKQQQEQQQKIQQQDTALADDIKSIRTKYKDLDFDALDSDGKSLEYKVLEHGVNGNFPSFKAAFLDFYHEQLEKMWESRGREAVSKDQVKRQKLGLSATPTPKAKTTSQFDVRGKSYNQILDEIVAQEGLT